MYSSVLISVWLLESKYRACMDVVIVRVMEEIIFGCFLEITTRDQYVSDG